MLGAVSTAGFCATTTSGVEVKTPARALQSGAMQSDVVPPIASLREVCSLQRLMAASSSGTSGTVSGPCGWALRRVGARGDLVLVRSSFAHTDTITALGGGGNGTSSSYSNSSSLPRIIVTPLTGN